MATVYVATDLRLERRVALKVMHGHLSDDTVFQSRFIQEARAAARLADPNVVNVFDQGSDGEVAYLVMEYLPGITLRDLLRQERRLSVAQTITIMDAVLSGLAAAHRAGIVHRDIKPENVLLAEDGRIKIGDFGLARATSANTATGQQLMGTIAYLAPELVTRGTADARSDIYSLGIMLYEMLTGEQPYRGEQPMQIAYQHATDSVPRPSVKNPGVPEPLDELVLWSTEKSPDERPVDAAAMLDRLREIEGDLGVSPQLVSAPNGAREGEADSGELTRVLPVTGGIPIPENVDNAAKLRRVARRQATRNGWLIAVIVVLAVMAGAVGWWFGSGPGSQIAVPDVAGQPFDDAALVVQDAGLSVARAGEYSLEVEAGVVIRTDPEVGVRLDKQSTVTLVVSEGPAPREIPALGGKAAADARATLAGLGLIVTEPDAEQFGDEAAGSVVEVTLAPRVGGTASTCTSGCAAFEGDTVSLTVSLGPIPAVAGKSVVEATQLLTDARLKVSSTEEYSDSVDNGDVIGIAPREGGGAWRPGDIVTLRVSKGPEPVQIPANVVGKSIRDAVDQLRGLGFVVNAGIEDQKLPLGNISYWDIYKVRATNPAAGGTAPKGSTITLTPTL